MKPEEQRIAIAEWCGWKFNEKHKTFRNRNGRWRKYIPNYLSDLNDIHHAEMILPEGNGLHGKVAFDNNLMRVCGSHQACVSATAAQRAEALLKTIGKWTDSTKGM